jgi:hypothetical protein
MGTGYRRTPVETSVVFWADLAVVRVGRVTGSSGSVNYAFFT